MKKVCTIMILVILSIGTTGCGKGLKDYVENGMESQISDRFDENKKALKKLYDANLIDKELYSSVKKEIEGKKDMYSNISEGNTYTIQSLLDSTVALKKLTTDNCGYYMGGKDKKVKKGDSDFTQSNIDDNTLSNYLLSNGSISLSSGSSVSNYKNSSCMTKKYDNGFKGIDNIDKWDSAIEIVGNSDLEKQLNAAVNYELYVLDEKNTGVTIDNITKTIETYTDDDGNISYNEKLDEYFKDSGTTLLGDNKVNIVKMSTKNFYSSKNEVGKDFVFTQNGEDIMSVRIKELNVKQINNLVNKMGINSGKYLFDRANKRCYLVEYPVEYISKLSTSNSGGSISGTLEKSDMGVNFYTGDLIKYTDGGIKGTVMGSGIEGYTSYLSVGNKGKKGKSAFITGTSQKIALEIDSSGKTVREVTTAGVILTDYLEATYAADFSEASQSDVYVFGRKIRLNVTGTSGGQVTIDNKKTGTIVDINGENVKDSNGKEIQLQYTDFMDISKPDGIVNKNSRGSDNYRVLRLPMSGETAGKQVKSASYYSGTPKIDNLAVQTVNEIGCTTRFPGDIIGSSLKSSEKGKQPIFYAIGTCTDMFQTYLYSSWIDSSSETASLAWWNKWLETVGYDYELGINQVKDYLAANFSYKLSQEGVVILDLETVAKIQSEYDAENKHNTAKALDAIFRVMGLIVIVYGVVLMLFWIIDTELSVGIRLYKIATFGRCEAVKYKEDEVDSESIRYISRGGAIIRSIVIIVVGTVLIRYNVLFIITKLMSSFGLFAKKVSELF